MRLQILLWTFVKSDSGTTMIEFSVVAASFFMFMMGIIEFGMYNITQITLQNAVAVAGRAASVGATEISDGVDEEGMEMTRTMDTASVVTTLIREKMASLPNASQLRIAVSPLANATAQGAQTRDYCLVGPNKTPTAWANCPAGIPFLDANNNGVYDGAAANMVSIGTPGQLVEVKATYPWKVLFPVMNQFFGQHGVVLINASTVVKNEPPYL